VAAKPHDSHFWRGLTKIKDEVLAKGSFDIKDKAKTRFWDDTWVGDKSLKDRYTALYNIMREPHTTVSKVMATSPLNISFRRALIDNKLLEWLNLVARISSVGLVDGFISSNEIELNQGLFLDCPLAKMIWRIIFFSTNLNQPRSISHMFGSWLINQHKRTKDLI